ncbi:Uma2 family endonuclease [Dyadobacter psychrotolerans]|uniref:Uma2 family endonuclease n=1 Tax=Dyadobacter psychrotolerans TaxID=2541721 RepID=A0A4R5DI83_9BACT|nr:Uma2 family endonuclease [Dyadobacter psychrotolerans]TDE11651.1 Uma2 family endonuclease [Dyadobacter psychrotolerans]
MIAVTEKLYTLEEYFAFCETHEGRFEFVNGEIIEMPGESVTANQIAGNIHRFLGNLLEDEPYIFVQNAVKLLVKEQKIFRIPDFLIFHEHGNKIKYATEPVLIVEILSESTAHTDRTTKLNEYRSLPSLQYYLIIDQESCFIQIYIRQNQLWYVEFYDKPGEIIPLSHFGVDLPVSTVYKKIKFQPEV